MKTSPYQVILALLALGAVVRALGVNLAFLRSLITRHRFVSFRLGWVEFLCMTEPFVVYAMVWWLWATRDGAHVPDARHAVGAALGALIMLAGWAVIVWTLVSWPKMFGGHGIRDDHELVHHGAYAVLRHPVYVGGYLLWIGLAVGYLSWPAILVSLFYVVPIYYLYMLAEERMMSKSFGASYAAYCEKVPRLVPRLRRGSASDRVDREQASGSAEASR